MERQSLFGAQTRGWSPEESEYLSENEVIEIIPNFSTNGQKLSFMVGDFGPFEPGIAVEVPIWFGMELAKCKKCRVLCPDWMKTSKLRDCYKREKENNSFEPLPFYYREIAKILLSNPETKHAMDLTHNSSAAAAAATAAVSASAQTQQQSKQMRILIQDIEDVRASKTRSGLRQLDADTFVVHLNNISANEIIKIRSNVTQVLNHFHAFQTITNADDNDNDNDGDTNTNKNNNNNGNRNPNQAREQNTVDDDDDDDDEDDDDDQNTDPNAGLYKRPPTKLRKLRN